MNPATESDRTTPQPLPLVVEIAVLLPLGALANLFDPKTGGNPQCVARGRDEAEIALNKMATHISTAKGTGQLAIAFGVPLLQRKLIARIDAARGRRPRPEPAADASRLWDAAGLVSDAAEVSGMPAPTDPDVHIEPTERREPTGATAGTAAIETDTLAIPGYDTLSASQIVERLAGLSEHDRHVLQAYEIAHRNRRTVLGKIDQLQASTT